METDKDRGEAERKVTVSVNPVIVRERVLFVFVQLSQRLDTHLPYDIGTHSGKQGCMRKLMYKMTTDMMASTMTACIPVACFGFRDIVGCLIVDVLQLMWSTAILEYQI